jgi:hypothetical protein
MNDVDAGRSVDATGTVSTGTRVFGGLAVLTGSAVDSGTPVVAANGVLTGKAVDAIRAVDSTTTVGFAGTVDCRRIVGSGACVDAPRTVRSGSLRSSVAGITVASGEEEACGRVDSGIGVAISVNVSDSFIGAVTENGPESVNRLELEKLFDLVNGLVALILADWSK